MPFRGLLPLLLGCLLPSPATAQDWLKALNAREYEKAAVLLHEIVSDPDFVMSGRDPLPFRHLARLYASGSGVAPDPVAACALAQDAEMATNLAPPTTPLLTTADHEQHRAGLEEAKRFAAEHCGVLSSAQTLAASLSRGGCYAFGMPEQVVTFPGRSVRIGRGGIALAERADHSPGLSCAAAIGRVRPVSLEPPEGAARGVAARHFIELVVWRVGRDQRTGTRVYVPSWQMYEVRRSGVEIVVEQMLEESPRWPGPAVPPDFDARLTMEMIRSGHVRWQIDGAPPRRGWLMLPAQRASR